MFQPGPFARLDGGAILGAFRFSRISFEICPCKIKDDQV